MFPQARLTQFCQGQQIPGMISCARQIHAIATTFICSREVGVESLPPSFEWNYLIYFLVSCVNPKLDTALGSFMWVQGISYTLEVYFKKAKINHNAVYDKCTSQLHRLFVYFDAGANVSTSPGWGCWRFCSWQDGNGCLNKPIFGLGIWWQLYTASYPNYLPHPYYCPNLTIIQTRNLINPLQNDFL